MKVEKINWFTLSTMYKADTCGHENENLTVITKDSLLFYPVITITICTQHTKYIHPTNDIMCFFVYRIVKTRSKSASDDLENGNEPPPLPEKEKRPSLVNSQDFFTSTPNAKSSLSLSGYSTPSNQSPHNSLIINDSFNSLMDCSSSPLSVSPLDRSPNSSISSGLNRSSEDLLDSANLRVRTNSFSRVHSESGIGLMKKLTTSLTKSASQSDGTIGQVNELTLKIDELTKGIAKLTNQNGENNLPPLPVKRSKPTRQTSMYDNVTDSGINLSRMEARMSSSSTSSSQSFSGFSISQKTTSVSYSHRTSSQETCSSSEAFSSTSHSSIDSLPKPPPLPPKKKHSKLFSDSILFVLVSFKAIIILFRIITVFSSK